MQQQFTTQKITATLLAFGTLAIPAVVSAHGGVDDGHGVVDADGHHAGGSELLKALSPRWWGLLAVATLITSGLSFGVWKYINGVAPKKTPPPASSTVKK